MTPVSQIPALYLALRNRWSERDSRIVITDQVVSGALMASDPSDQDLINRSPNLIQVGIEDTAEAASTLPTIRVTPSTGSQGSKDKADAMERIACSYTDRSRFELLNIESLMDLVAFGMHAWTVTFDTESGGPVIEWRDPRTCYPESGWRPGDSVRSCIFARQVHVRQLPADYQALIEAEVAVVAPRDSRTPIADRKVVLVELFEEDYIQLTALYESGVGPQASKSWCPVLLERTETPGGICPVVIGQRITLDRTPRGQFDQVVKVLQAHVRLMSLILDYSDQAVYSDVWVKDLIGQMPYGGGSFIQLGAQGQIGRVQPAVTSFAVDNLLDQLVTNIHLGGRWPKSRPGEIDQAIASAKFIEATAGMMNTVIRTLHLVMKRSLEQALRICFVVDKELGATRTVAGVLRNQQFMVERKKDDIDLKAQVRVDYGIGLGRDPAQTMVLGIQGMQTGLFSTEFVQENFDGITDVAKERKRIDVQQLRDMAFAQLLEGLQAKSIPPSALVQIAQRRANGDDIFALFDEFIVKPQEEALSQQIPSGMGGPPSMPGADPSMSPGGGVPPAPPEAAALMAALSGGGGPPGPPPGDEGKTGMIGRLSVPLGGGGFAGTQTQG